MTSVGEIRLGFCGRQDHRQGQVELWTFADNYAELITRTPALPWMAYLSLLVSKDECCFMGLSFGLWWVLYLWERCLAGSFHQSLQASMFLRLVAEMHPCFPSSVVTYACKPLKRICPWYASCLQCGDAVKLA